MNGKLSAIAVSSSIFAKEVETDEVQSYSDMLDEALGEAFPELVPFLRPVENGSHGEGEGKSELVNGNHGGETGETTMENVKQETG